MGRKLKESETNGREEMQNHELNQVRGFYLYIDV